MELLRNASSDCTTGVCWRNISSQENEVQTDRKRADRQTRREDLRGYTDSRKKAT